MRTKKTPDQSTVAPVQEAVAPMPKADISSPLLTTNQAAELMNIQPWTLRMWAAKGLGPRCYRFDSGTLRFAREDIATWLASKKGGEQ